MCHYKPLVITFIFSFASACMMLFFTLGMWMYIGDFFPSYRYKYTWFWTLFSYLIETLHMVICAMMLYKQNNAKYINAACFCTLVILLANWIVLSIINFPEMTKEEFKTYVFDFLRSEDRVPGFMDYFQYKIGCCGVDNYKDYFKAFGTRIQDEHVVFDVPRSCCFSKNIGDRNCGQGIRFRFGEDERNQSVKTIANGLNSNTVGCYSKFRDIVYSDSHYQLTVFEAVYKIIPITFIVQTIIHLAVYFYYYSKTKSRVHLVLTGQAGRRVVRKRPKLQNPVNVNPTVQVNMFDSDN